MKDQPGEQENNADLSHTDDGGRERSGASTEEEPRTEATVEPDIGRAAASEASGDSELSQRETADGGDPRDRDDEEERRKSAEDFAREHDPARHDISAGEQSRQTGDWTADEAGGPQVWDADGNLVEGTTPGEPGRSRVYQNGREVYRFAVNVMGESALRAVENAGLDPSQIDLLVPHQANIRIIESAAKRLNLPMDKVFVNVHKYGNTSAASIPMALREARDAGRIKHGDNVVIVGFGAGLTWAAAAIKWMEKSGEVAA